MQIYDVIVVGAGPAGSMAAYHLAQAGLSVLILEKTHFPRRKVCGGALTQRALNEIPFDISPVIHRTVDWGYLGYRGRKVCAIHGDSPISYLVDRASFDVFLLEKAINQGAHCVQGARVHSLQTTETGVAVQTQTETYQGRFLVGADGIHSVVARQNGFPQFGPTSLCYEARLALPEHLAENALDAITFDFGTLWWGYAWIFPKRDHLNVGVFHNWPGRKTTRQHLLRFIRQHPGLHKEDILDIRAFPGPLGGKPNPLHRGRVLLAGDAAHLADPWLGEGIYYALASGRTAAKTILREINNPTPDLSAYSQRIAETFVHQFKFARRFALLVNLFYHLNVTLLKESSTLQNIIIDLLRGDRTCEQVWHDLWSDAPKMLQKLFRKNK